MKSVFVFAKDGESVPLENYKIGMKFKEDMSLYTEEEIRSPGVSIKSP